MLELTLSILLHAGLGIALAALVWAAGFGVVAAAPRAGLPLEPASVLAYPAGLLLALVACLAYLLTPWLGLLGLAVVLAALALSRPAWGALRRAAAVTAWALPAVVGLPVVLGFFLHGPSRRVDSNAFGDVVWYVAKLASAKESLFPFRDLAASGVHLWRAEIAPSLLGAVVTELRGRTRSCSTPPSCPHLRSPRCAPASRCSGPRRACPARSASCSRCLPRPPSPTRAGSPRARR